METENYDVDGKAEMWIWGVFVVFGAEPHIIMC